MKLILIPLLCLVCMYAQPPKKVSITLKVAQSKAAVALPQDINPLNLFVFN
ncbi:MAG: hypothetical protein M3342_04740 [Bacteroidota bacterium]|nr:hypothetical protein [Flavisolibacter sp.]MBD0297328.1 hypothetical protein [Flavisolibacter sp.]MBD0364864.1 hypothetical protein [Flavisolibacter sp.]MBD0375605.1 hypothetical protein [Flavisolibacter sp.]MDQ3843304.1 hypothetical protein [Bacteroidota bacterium]